MKGTYFLLINCERDCSVIVGAYGPVVFKKGNYIYVGSAMNSIEKRVERHIKKSKIKKWHIDYLTTNKNFKIIKVYQKISSKKRECEFSKKLVKKFEYLKNFGCSDCKCESHLYKINLNEFDKFIKLNKIEQIK